MLNRVSPLLRSSRRRWLYGLMAIITAISISINVPTQPTYAASWLEILLRGAQVFQLSSMSNRQETKLGKEINDELINSGRVKLYKNSQITNYVNEIGQKLANTSSRADITYTIQVVDDNSINAFATMGGYVYFNTGLIKTADNEAELASVIGHEIGHIAARHSIKQMRQQAIAQGVLSAAGLEESAAIQIGVELALNRPKSRGDELEADRLGLENLKEAGYAPGAMVSFMQKLLKKGGSVPTILSTHPSTSDRITALQSQIEPGKENIGAGLDNQAYKQKIRPLL